jgi:hypothetical protein
MDKKQPLQPHEVICVITHDGKEVGRIAASAQNATDYFRELYRHYGNIQVEYVKDADAAMISRMIQGGGLRR